MNPLSHKYGTYEKQKELLSMISDVDLILRGNNID